MKKVKRMMFGGVSKAAGKSLQQVSKMPGGVNQNAPEDVQKMMANLPRGSTVAAPSKPGMTGLGSAMAGGMRPPGAGGMTAGPKPGGMMGGIRNAVNQAVAQAPVRPLGSPAAPSGGIVAKAAPGGGLGPGGMKEGGKVSSASKRADGCAIKGKTKGKMV